MTTTYTDVITLAYSASNLNARQELVPSVANDLINAAANEDRPAVAAMLRYLSQQLSVETGLARMEALGAKTDEERVAAEQYAELTYDIATKMSAACADAETGRIAQ